jgi:hypothetical protein
MNYATKEVDFSAATVSDALDLGGGSIIAIVFPSTWSGTVLTFLASHDDTNFFDVYDEAGDQVSYTVAASRYVAIPPSKGIAMDACKIESDQSETATITLLIK